MELRRRSARDADLYLEGFTGHRAELDLGLVDMGGRMYDPVFGRFTSADPLVSSPWDAQAYTRYSYVGNRPLRFVDPTGWAAEDPDDDGGGAEEDEDASEEDGLAPGDNPMLDWVVNLVTFGAWSWWGPSSTLNGTTEVGWFDALGGITPEALATGVGFWYDKTLGAPYRFLKNGAIERAEALKVLAEDPADIPRKVVLGLAGDLVNAGTTYGDVYGMLAAGDVMGGLTRYLEGAQSAWNVAGTVYGAGRLRGLARRSGRNGGGQKALPSAFRKVPEPWGSGTATRKGGGTRWQDPTDPGNGIRIDPGNPASSLPSQRVDHAVIRSNGRVLGRDGKPLSGSIKSSPTDAHIPMSEWLNWSSWDTP